MPSEITRIDIRYKKRKNLRAFVDIEINNEIAVNGLSVIQGEDGLFVGMPFRENTNKEGKKFYNRIFQPIKDDGGPGTKFGQRLQEKILEYYHENKQSDGDDDI